MKKEMQLQNSRKWIFVVTVFISFVAFYLYNVFTPYMSDDMIYLMENNRTLGDILRQQYMSYGNHTGRAVLEMISRIFFLFPKAVFDVANSFCFVGTMLLIYCNIKERKKYDVLLYILINLLMWILSVDFCQTVLWLTGACNYIWGMFFILGFISMYRFFLEKGHEMKNKVVVALLLFTMGVLAGWCNENTSGGAILIVLLLSLKYYFDNKKIEKVMMFGIGGAIIGFLFMILAPGNAARGTLVAEGEVYTGVALLISRGLKILKAIDEHLLLYMIVICLLGTYFYYSKKYQIKEFYEIAIYVLASLATAAVLILTTEPMARAYFGANIYMMIAVLQMIQKIREEDTLLIALKNGGIIAATLAMVFVYVEEGANLVRIRREIDIRENYILEQREKGEYALVLPALRTEFESKYSWLHYVDISNDEENWNNDIYRIYYGIDPVEVLPWNEWEEIIDK